MAQLNEVKRMQQLANIKEAEENQSMDSKATMDAEKKVFQVVNSNEFNAAMEKEWAKLSDEDRKKLAQSISSLNETIGSDFASFRKMVQKAKDVEGINEEEVDMDDFKTAIGDILGTVGKINCMGLAGAPGFVIAMALGAPAAFGLPIYLASFAAGGILWWLGKKIADSGYGASDYLDETVNEALAKFRKTGK